MSEHSYNMRVHSRYAGEDNAVSSLAVEYRVEGDWRPFELGIETPGFDVFVYSILTCQHTYFRINCAERGLLLDKSTGYLVIDTDALRTIESLRVHFHGSLRDGEPAAEDIGYVESRMGQCPVSRNLVMPPDVSTSVSLEHQAA